MVHSGNAFQNTHYSLYISWLTFFKEKQKGLSALFYYQTLLNSLGSCRLSNSEMYACLQ